MVKFIVLKNVYWLVDLTCSAFTSVVDALGSLSLESDCACSGFGRVKNQKASVSES